MNQLKALDLANYILKKFPNNTISPMKLQKLAFYCTVWTLVAGNNAISAPFQKWPYGPVNINIYNCFKRYGKNNISNVDIELSKEVPSFFKAQLDFILESYGNYTAVELSNMTHEEDPWINAKNNAIISKKSILKYYSTKSFANNFKEVGDNFHIIEDDSWDAFVLDMDQDEIDFYQSFKSYSKFKKMSESASLESNQLFDNFLSKYISA